MDSMTLAVKKGALIALIHLIMNFFMRLPP